MPQYPTPPAVTWYSGQRRQTATRCEASADTASTPADRARAPADLAIAREIDASDPNARVVNGALVKNELTQREHPIAAYYRPAGCEDRKVNGNKLPVAGCQLPVKTNTLSVVRGPWSVAKTEH